MIKPYRVILLAVVVLGLAGVSYLSYRHYHLETPKDPPYTSIRQTTGPRHEMRGFRFYGNYAGKRTISIKADRFTIEKKKFGFFRFGLMNVAKLSRATVDIYGQRKESAPRAAKHTRSLQEGPQARLEPTPEAPDATPTPQDGKPSPKPNSGITFGHAFSKKSMSSFPIRRVYSIVMEPVRLSFYDDKFLATSISADSASVRLKNGEILFKGNVKVVSGSKVLSSERLKLILESGALIVDRHFELKTPKRQFSANHLTTDIFLSSL